MRLIWGAIQNLASGIKRRAVVIFHRLRARVSDWIAPRYTGVVVEEFLPASPKPNVLYIVEEDGYREYAAMICPCGCGQVLNMNLLPDERPMWKVYVDSQGRASLHPSVWRKKGCRSHFWLKQGRIRWCNEM